MQHSTTTRHEATQASDASGIVAVVAAGLIALTAVDLLVFLLGGLHTFSKLSWYVIRFDYVLFAGATAWIVWVGAKLRQRAWVVILASLVIAYLVCTRFRGLWVWPGTFDLYEQSALPWLLASLVGIVLGAASALFFQLRYAQGSVPNDFTYLVALAISAMTVFLCGRASPLDSRFAETRSIALGMCALVLGALWFALGRKQ